jgi:hypothetical protein
MLVFLDKVRDRTNGKVNLMLTSTYPIFNDESPAPIPMISRFVNLFNPERIYKTAYEDMFQKKISPETLKKIVSVSGDYAYIIKSIQRDLEFYHLKPEAILERQFDQDFFDEFVNVKISLDRIKSQMHPLVLRTMGKLINGAALEPEEEFVKQTYLSKVGILDEHGQVRGKIMPAYCKLYCSQGVAKAQPAPVATPVPVETIQKVMTTTNTERYLNVTAELKIDKISGQILINDINGTYLSEKELKIFALLFRNRGKEVSREAIAKDIWTGHEASSYSDWAMDKLISRIREKLGDARPYRLIKTSRKIGFILN